jgi:hypothetical protein
MCKPDLHFGQQEPRGKAHQALVQCNMNMRTGGDAQCCLDLRGYLILHPSTKLGCHQVLDFDISIDKQAHVITNAWQVGTPRCGAFGQG